MRHPSGPCQATDRPDCYVGAGLAKQLVPIFVGGGIDSKTDPRLVQPGGLLELENMWMMRTGELRWRNGFTSFTKNQNNGGAITSISSLFRSQTGTLCAIASRSSGGPPSIRTFLQYDPVSATWKSGNEANPLPTVTASVSQAAASQTVDTLFTTNDLVDCDSAVAGGLLLTCWTEQGGASAGAMVYTITNEATGTTVIPQQQCPMDPSSRGHRVRAVAGGNSFLCMAEINSFGTSLIISVINVATLAISTTTLALNLVSAATPLFDLKPRPGSNNILVAYKATAGGVTCLEFNPATNTVVTGPVNTASADATMAIAWLDDSLATGSYLLATAGATDGIKVRTMSATLVVTATNTIFSGATTGVRNMIGYVNSSISNYVVLWDVDATPAYKMATRRATWTGSVSVTVYVLGLGIYSRAFKASDGHYYYVASYDSTVQATYCLLQADAAPGSLLSSQCNFLSNNAGGRTVAVNVPASVYLSDSGKYILAAPKKLNTLGERAIQTVRFNFSPPSMRAREIGSTLFLPGGVPLKFDGTAMSWSTIPFAPEAPVVVTNGTPGPMTAGGTYEFYLVTKRIDANGRVIRSVPSLPGKVTLGPTDTQAIVSALTLPFAPINTEIPILEFYRRGDESSGAQTINKTGELGLDITTLAVTTGGGPSDLAAAAGEILYTTGGILENFPAPSHNLLEINNGRVWVVNAEDPTQLWPSKEYKPGLGIGFHPDLAFSVTGDGFGAITALASMDSRLVVFKSSAIYVVAGDGPDDTGAPSTGSFTAPQNVSLNVGTVLPGSVVATPDGIMFQSAKGIYLLDRGLALTYLGKAVEKYTQLENVVDASLVDNATQVRFVQASGRCLVYDYDAKRWYTFLLPVGASSIVACANIAAGWCYALADGTVKQEIQGQYSDDGVAIIPRITFPHLALGGINGFQRVRAIQILGEYVGDHTLIANMEYNYSGTVDETRTRLVTAGPYAYEIPIAKQKSNALKLTLTCLLPPGSGGFRLSGVTLEVGVKKGSNFANTSRLR